MSAVSRPAARPYVDRPIADRRAAARIATAAAAAWSLPTPEPMRFGMNALYRSGGVVLRVGHATATAEASHSLARRLLEHGIPTVVPFDGAAADIEGFAVTGWCAVTETDTAIDWSRVGEVIRLVHSLDVDLLPPEYPVVDPTRLPWWDFDAMLQDVDGVVDDDAIDGLRAAVDRGRGWQDDVRDHPVLCHGDVHPGNVLSTPAGEVLADWDLLALADPAWDHAMLSTFAARWGGDPSVYTSFLAGYGRPAADPALIATLGEMRNVAATLLRVRAASTDPTAAAEALRRLAYWRGESDDAWVAQ